MKSPTAEEYHHPQGSLFTQKRALVATQQKNLLHSKQALYIEPNDIFIQLST
jgi:hypothetical protein